MQSYLVSVCRLLFHRPLLLNDGRPLALNIRIVVQFSAAAADITCVIRDIVDQEHDARLASFVVDSHARGVSRQEDAQPEPDVTSEGVRESGYQLDGITCPTWTNWLILYSAHFSRHFAKVYHVCSVQGAPETDEH
jgi:hypothetical protein